MTKGSAPRRSFAGASASLRSGQSEGHQISIARRVPNQMIMPERRDNASGQDDGDLATSEVAEVAGCHRFVADLVFGRVIRGGSRRSKSDDEGNIGRRCRKVSVGFGRKPTIRGLVTLDMFQGPRIHRCCRQLAHGGPRNTSWVTIGVVTGFAQLRLLRRGAIVGRDGVNHHYCSGGRSLDRRDLRPNHGHNPVLAAPVCPAPGMAAPSPFSAERGGNSMAKLVATLLRHRR